MSQKHSVIPALLLIILGLGLVNIGCERSTPDPQPTPRPQSTVVAKFTTNVDQSTAGTPIEFVDLSSGNIEEWLWEFGDGETSINRNPTHSYEREGTYTVVLTVTNGSQTDTEIKSGQIKILGANQIPSHVTGEIRVLYEWARTVEGDVILEQVPCYCPCKALGHRHTRDCYWKDSGSFEEHGVDCGECLDIAEKAKTMFEQGEDICEIREVIDLYYADKADIATDTPMPEGCETGLLLFGGIK